MSIRIKCESCGTIYSVDAALAGRVGTCKKCNQKIAIPIPSNPSRSTNVDAQPSTVPAVAQASRPPEGLKSILSEVESWGVQPSSSATSSSEQLAGSLAEPSTTVSESPSKPLATRNQREDISTESSLDGPRQVEVSLSIRMAPFILPACFLLSLPLTAVVAVTLSEKLAAPFILLLLAMSPFVPMALTRFFYIRFHVVKSVVDHTPILHAEVHPQRRLDWMLKLSLVDAIRVVRGDHYILALIGAALGFLTLGIFGGAIGLAQETMNSGGLFERRLSRIEFVGREQSDEVPRRIVFGSKEELEQFIALIRANSKVRIEAK